MQNLRTFRLMFKQLVEILDTRQKKQGVILFFLLICVSFLEMLGISVVIPFVIAMLEPDKIMGNRYVVGIINILHLDAQQELLYLIAGLIILVYILKNGMILAVNYYQTNYRNTLEKNLSVQMLSSYMKRPYVFFLDVNSAEIMRGITGDIAGIAAVLDSFSGFLAEALTCLFIGSFIVWLNPFIAFYLLLIAGCTALLLVLVFKKKIGECGVSTRDAFAERYQHAYQAVNGIKEITVMQRRDAFVRRYEQASEKARKYNNIYLFITKMPNRLVETVFLGSLIILVCISLGNAQSQTNYVSVLGALAVAAVRILPSISNIAGYINGLVYNRPALEAAYINIMEARKFDKINSKQGQKVIENNVEKEPLSFHNSVFVNHIFWRYKEDLPYVLQDLSLEIKKGEAVAFIGESGAGKTTLADIVLGLLKPQKGQVTVDGKDVFEMLPQWAGIVGYVPQSVFLIDDTIRNNVAFGIPEAEQDEEQIWHVLEEAQLRHVVEKSAKGLDTVVGERGIKFSGGQRQRIAIARALYYNPEILVLDEATSALDTETESAVMESIDALHGKKTLIIVAHRLSTIRKCDKIYEIADGKIGLRTGEIGVDG